MVKNECLIKNYQIENIAITVSTQFLVFKVDRKTFLGNLKTMYASDGNLKNNWFYSSQKYHLPVLQLN